MFEYKSLINQFNLLFLASDCVSNSLVSLSLKPRCLVLLSRAISHYCCLSDFHRWYTLQICYGNLFFIFYRYFIAILCFLYAAKHASRKKDQEDEPGKEEEIAWLPQELLDRWLAEPQVSLTDEGKFAEAVT